MYDYTMVQISRQILAKTPQSIQMQNGAQKSGTLLANRHLEKHFQHLPIFAELLIYRIGSTQIIFLKNYNYNNFKSYMST